MQYQVECYDANTLILIEVYDNANKASEKLNIDVASIYKCCDRKRRTAGGYIWRKCGDDLEPIPNRKKPQIGTPVKCYHPDYLTIPIREFPSLNEAAKAYGTTTQRISESCNRSYFKVKGLLWRYSWDSAPRNITPEKNLELTAYIPIYQIDKDTYEIIDRWPSVASVIYNHNRKTGIKRANVDGILACCQGLIEEHAGYKWGYAEEPIGIENRLREIADKLYK